MTEQVDIQELRKTAAERRRLHDDIAADALNAAATEIERLRGGQLATNTRQFPIVPEAIAEGAPMVRVPMVLVERARWAMQNENLEMLDETIEEIIEAAGRPHESAEADTNALRARHHALMLNFPDQGYDWRTPVTALVNEIPGLADEIDRLRVSASGDRRAIDTAADLDALPVGAVLRGLGNYGGVWEVVEAEDVERYSSAANNSYNTSAILLEHWGPFELLWAPEA